MDFAALATDYDGTIARDGRVEDSTRRALETARRGGLRLVLVTGRILDDLGTIFAPFDLFDRIVAENGAVLHDPATGASRMLASPPPPALLRALRDAAVPYLAGQTIVDALQAYEPVFARTIRELGLPWHLILNKGSLMALPSGVTKASGVACALADLGVPAERTIAFGDAENDVAMLQACGLAVAVANALPAVKAAAGVVTDGEAGDGVREFVERLLAGVR
jgi:hydroxymethylpyrimidine pyrophosphatase-like HAD family hydrolase